MPAFLQSPPQGGYGFGASVTQARLLLLSMTVAIFLSGLLSVRLSSSLGARTVLVTTAGVDNDHLAPGEPAQVGVPGAGGGGVTGPGAAVGDSDQMPDHRPGSAMPVSMCGGSANGAKGQGTASRSVGTR